MSNENKYEIRVMTIDDYDEVYSLWQTIHGFGIRSIDDSREEMCIRDRYNIHVLLFLIH